MRWLNNNIKKRSQRFKLKNKRQISFHINKRALNPLNHLLKFKSIN